MLWISCRVSGTGSRRDRHSSQSSSAADAAQFQTHRNQRCSQKALAPLATIFVPAIAASSTPSPLGVSAAAAVAAVAAAHPGVSRCAWDGLPDRRCRACGLSDCSRRWRRRGTIVTVEYVPARTPISRIHANSWITLPPKSRSAVYGRRSRLENRSPRLQAGGFRACPQIASPLKRATDKADSRAKSGPEVFLVDRNAMPPQEFHELFLERPLLVMRLLTFDVSSDCWNIRLADAECSVSPLPREC